MPIYGYRCAACGHQEDHLQKVSEAPLSKCPKCGKKKYEKQLSAAGFQLKGSGWYVTDFRGGAKKSESGEAKSEGSAEPKAESKPESKAEAKSEAKSEAKADKKKSASKSAN